MVKGIYFLGVNMIILQVQSKTVLQMSELITRLSIWTKKTPYKNFNGDDAMTLWGDVREYLVTPVEKGTWNSFSTSCSYTVIRKTCISDINVPFYCFGLEFSTNCSLKSIHYHLMKTNEILVTLTNFKIGRGNVFLISSFTFVV